MFEHCIIFVSILFSVFFFLLILHLSTYTYKEDSKCDKILVLNKLCHTNKSIYKPPILNIHQNIVTSFLSSLPQTRLQNIVTISFNYTFIYFFSWSFLILSGKNFTRYPFIKSNRWLVVTDLTAQYSNLS